MGGNLRNRLRAVVAPALLVVLPLCLFGPYTIFSGNEAEFSAPFWTLVRPILLGGAGTALMLIVFGLLLPSRLLRPFVALLFGIGVVIWIQGSFLVPDYGPLDGTAIDWTAQAWRNPYEMALWTLVPVLCVVAARYVGGIAHFASGVLVTMQSLVLLVSTLQADAKTTARWRGPSDSMFELSRTQNVIHIVLDAFQSDFFYEILEENRQELDRSLSGAVFFADHSGAFPTTMVSIPAMLTGTVYRQEQTLPRYVREHFDERIAVQVAARARVARRQHQRDSVRRQVRVEWLQDSPAACKLRRVHAVRRLAAGRSVALPPCAAHPAAAHLQRSDDGACKRCSAPAIRSGRRHFPVNGAAVLQEFAERLTLSLDEPVYKFIHVGIPHRPVTIEADCDFVEGLRPTRENYKGQTRCAVRRLVAYSIASRTLGVYDDSLIIVSSDHGIGYAPRKFVNDRQTPAGRAVDPFGEIDGAARCEGTGQPGRRSRVPCADIHQRRRRDRPGRVGRSTFAARRARAQARRAVPSACARSGCTTGKTTAGSTTTSIRSISWKSAVPCSMGRAGRSSTAFIRRTLNRTSACAVCTTSSGAEPV